MKKLVQNSKFLFSATVTAHDLMNLEGFKEATLFNEVDWDKTKIVDAHGHVMNSKTTPSDFLLEYYGFEPSKIPWNIPGMFRDLERMWGKIFYRKKDLVTDFESFTDFGLSSWLYSFNMFKQFWFDSYTKNEFEEDQIVVCPIAIDMTYAMKKKAKISYLEQLILHFELAGRGDMFRAELEDRNVPYPKGKGFRREMKHVEPCKVGQFLPIVMIDPRGFSETDYYTDMIEAAFNSGAVGAKFYPSYGYLPTHDVLYEEAPDGGKCLFALFEEHNVPILSHCDRDGTMSTFNEFPLNGIDYETGKKYDPKVDIFKPVDHEELRTFFMHPLQWKPVVEKFKNLKLNIAHWGGMENWCPSDTTPKLWRELILEMVQDEELCVYADISYSNCMEESIDQIWKYFPLEGVKDKMLYGTDFYMNKLIRPPKEHVRMFLREFPKGSKEMNKLSVENPKNFFDPDY